MKSLGCPLPWALGGHISTRLPPPRAAEPLETTGREEERLEETSGRFCSADGKRSLERCCPPPAILPTSLGKLRVFRPDSPDQGCCLARVQGTVGRKVGGGKSPRLQPFIELAPASPEARTRVLSCHSDPFSVWRVKNGAGGRGRMFSRTKLLLS